MTHFVAGMALIALAASAHAQSSATPPAPSPPPPAPSPPPPAQTASWYRFTLNDGRVIDVQIVGGDAANYHILTAGQVYSLPRASVVASAPLAQPAAQSMAYPPPPPPVAQPIDDDRNILQRNPRAVGIAYFAAGYLITMPIALARLDNDSDASAGLIPVVGPLIWTMSHDEDDPFEDGWDWLAATDTLIQGFGVYLILKGGGGSSRAGQVTVSPLGRHGAHGLALSGSF